MAASSSSWLICCFLNLHFVSIAVLNFVRSNALENFCETLRFPFATFITRVACRKLSSFWVEHTNPSCKEEYHPRLALVSAVANRNCSRSRDVRSTYTTPSPDLHASDAYTRELSSCRRSAHIIGSRSRHILNSNRSSELSIQDNLGLSREQNL